MGESILGVAVGTGAGRLDLGPVWNSKQRSITVKRQALCVSKVKFSVSYLDLLYLL